MPSTMNLDHNRRDDVTARKVDLGVELADKEGLGPAVDFLRQQGIPEGVLFRILCSPQLHRKIAAIDQVVEGQTPSGV